MLTAGSGLFQLILVTIVCVPQDLCIPDCLYSSFLGSEA